ncbi:hypothetical protein ACNTMW_32855 [Planosporangium sp. 12N6]|uniref:hypothetical protein n=1 Tax=Planosporangium spinosum TaxID=3402278 RepID=UPI003CE9219C
MSEHVTAEGVPLRADGTPFPDDPSQWTPEEREYLQSYVFGVNKEDGEERTEVAMVDVPEASGEDGEALA